MVTCNKICIILRSERWLITYSRIIDILAEKKERCQTHKFIWLNYLCQFCYYDTFKLLKSTFIFCVLWYPLKGPWHEIFDLCFFHQSTSPRPCSKIFYWFLFWICGDIFANIQYVDYLQCGIVHNCDFVLFRIAQNHIYALCSIAQK
jgi:hypothetical protein